MKFVKRAVILIRTGFADGVDLRAIIASELRRIRVHLNSEFAYGCGSQRSVRRAARRAVREVVLQRSIQQVNIRANILPVNADA